MVRCFWCIGTIEKFNDDLYYCSTCKKEYVYSKELEKFIKTLPKRTLPAGEARSK